MKHILPSLFLTAFLLLLGNCSGHAQSGKPAAAKAGADRIEVLDFHTTHRCKTCLTIEKHTRQLLADSYGQEMKKGRIIFRLINADDEANKAIVKKYFAFGTTLIVNTVSGGAEQHVDLTNFAFLNAEDETTFKAGLKEALDAGLRKIK